MEWLGNFATTGTPPASRKGHSMTKLVNSSLALVFGGEDGEGNVFNDMYSLHIERAEWRRITYAPGPCPAPRLLHTATAISSTAIVILFGDTACGPTVDKASTSTSNDAWIFDLKDLLWREIKHTGPYRPPPLSCHTAVLGSGPGSSLSIFVFGGLAKGNVGSSVHRLSLSDWRWHFLPFYVINDQGNDVLIDTPPTDNEEFRSEPGGPGRRESHGAVWVPDMNGMVIVGGDGGVELFDDCWLFNPSQTEGVWRWKQLHMTIARGLPQNRLPKSAGHSLLTYPSDGKQLLMWGGLHWPETQNDNSAKNCYIIDLDVMQTTMVKVTGSVSRSERLLHGIVRLNKQLVMYGGCCEDGAAISSTQEGRLVPLGKPGGQAAMDFGPEASTLAAQGSAVLPEGRKEEDIREENSEGDEDDAAYLPLVGPSSIPPGTPLSGRIIDVTDFGYFVSVVINGKLCKGLLVAHPLKGDGGFTLTKLSANTEPPKEPEPKRKRVDPIADALPDLRDPEDSPQEAKRIPADEVITLD